MMNQQPDKFFREKLEGFSKPVPSTSWNKVAMQLDKKKNNWLWLKVAASLLLLCTISLFLWNRDNDNTSIQFISKHNEKVPTPPATEQKSPINTSTHTPLVDSLTSNTKKEVTSKPLPKRKTEQVQKPDIDKLQENSFQENSIAAVLEEVNEHSADTPENETSTLIEPTHHNKSLTIVYEAEEINDKYLNTDAIEEATSDYKKTSTLRKLLDKANDLKNNQDPLGDLRQKKNEILALNFKNEKQRNQNR